MFNYICAGHYIRLNRPYLFFCVNQITGNNGNGYSKLIGQCLGSLGKMRVDVLQNHLPASAESRKQPQEPIAAAIIQKGSFAHWFVAGLKSGFQHPGINFEKITTVLQDMLEVCNRVWLPGNSHRVSGTKLLFTLSAKALLPRAGQQGGARVQQYLQGLLQSTTGCGTGGKADCWPCLRKGGALQSAITAIGQRGATPP